MFKNYIKKKELHKHQIKNDEPGLYTCTIKDGKERGEIHSGAEQGEAEWPNCAILDAERTHDSSPTPCDSRTGIM